jgi:hypothetical protein
VVYAWNPWWLATAMLAFGVLANVPCLLVQQLQPRPASSGRSAWGRARRRPYTALTRSSPSAHTGWSGWSSIVATTKETLAWARPDGEWRPPLRSSP